MQKPSCSCSFAPLKGPLAAREQKCEFLYQRLTQTEFGDFERGGQLLILAPGPLGLKVVDSVRRRLLGISLFGPGRPGARAEVKIAKRVFFERSARFYRVY